jgi:hypothetical protein
MLNSINIKKIIFWLSFLFSFVILCTTKTASAQSDFIECAVKNDNTQDFKNLWSWLDKFEQDLIQVDVLDAKKNNYKKLMQEVVEKKFEVDPNIVEVEHYISIRGMMACVLPVSFGRSNTERKYNFLFTLYAQFSWEQTAIDLKITETGFSFNQGAILSDGFVPALQKQVDVLKAKKVPKNEFTVYLEIEPNIKKSRIDVFQKGLSALGIIDVRYVDPKNK